MVVISFSCFKNLQENFKFFIFKPWFLRVCRTSLLKTLREKEKLLVMNSFSFFPQCFLPTWRTFCHFHQIYNCRLQTLSIWKNLNWFGKGLRNLFRKSCSYPKCFVPKLTNYADRFMTFYDASTPLIWKIAWCIEFFLTLSQTSPGFYVSVIKVF